MADFLSRLAERTLGIGGTVEPRLAPLFAGGAGLADDGLVEEDETVVAPRRETRVDAPAGLVAPRADERATEGPRAASDEAHPYSDDAPVVERRTIERQAPAPLPPLRAPAEDRVPGPPHPDAVEVGALRETQPPLLLPERRIAPAPLPALQTPVRAAPAPAAEPSATSSLDRASSPARIGDATPTVRVTIGRVEVRAVFPAAEAPRSAPAPWEPSLTLEEYLKQRREGLR